MAFTCGLVRSHVSDPLRSKIFGRLARRHFRLPGAGHFRMEQQHGVLGSRAFSSVGFSCSKAGARKAVCSGIPIAAALSAAAVATQAQGPTLAQSTETSSAGALSDSAPRVSWDRMPPGVVALHALLVDLARAEEASPPCEIFCALLQQLWAEMKGACLPWYQAEMLLHRLAESYGHGTLRPLHVRRLAKVLRQVGVTSVVDPMAHTGFHARLLAELGALKVEASDESPSLLRCWVPVSHLSIRDVGWGERCGEQWALFLSWAPHWSEAGCDAVRAFRGNTLVLLGDDGDWTGTDALRVELATSWKLHEEWSTDTPWPRVEEKIRVFTRSC